MLRTAVGILCLLLALPACALSVVFINPGKSDEAYWLAASQAMEAAARNLGVRLEVRYAQRDYPRIAVMAREILARPRAQRPDYVIFTNDHAVAPELLRLFEGSGIKSFLAFSSLSPQEHRQLGGPRENFKDWIGALEPQAFDAGYLTAQALIAQGRAAGAQGPDGRLHLLAIAGDRSTPSSMQRTAGMRQAVAEAGDTVLDQEVYAEWGSAKAAEQAQWLFQRHPQARLVWAGNDLMAFGAMQALEQRGGTPGQAMWFSGVNTSVEALQALRSGRLTALAGGHFITGAWALVLVYDHARGRDFADEGLELARPMFALFDAALAERFEKRFGQGYDGVDFRRYSKVLNPRLKRYDFGFAQLLR